MPRDLLHGSDRPVSPRILSSHRRRGEGVIRVSPCMVEVSGDPPFVEFVRFSVLYWLFRMEGCRAGPIWILPNRAEYMIHTTNYLICRICRVDPGGVDLTERGITTLLRTQSNYRRLSQSTACICIPTRKVCRRRRNIPSWHTGSIDGFVRTLLPIGCRSLSGETPQPNKKRTTMRMLGWVNNAR